MKECKRCGSYAINHTLHGRDGSDHDLCDVCYWRKRAEVVFQPGVEDGRAKDTHCAMCKMWHKPKPQFCQSCGAPPPTA